MAEINKEFSDPAFIAGEKDRINTSSKTFPALSEGRHGASFQEQFRTWIEQNQALAITGGFVLGILLGLYMRR